MSTPTPSMIAFDEAMKVFKAQTNLKPLTVEIAGLKVTISTDKIGRAIVWFGDRGKSLGYNCVRGHLRELDHKAESAKKVQQRYIPWGPHPDA